MPRRYQMSWEGPPANRWRKMYKGQVYRVTCEELRSPLYTAEGSYKLANDWWKKKLAELERPDPATALLNRYQIEDLREIVAKGEAAAELLASKSLSEPHKKDLYHPRALEFLMEEYRALPFLEELASKVEGKPVQSDHTLSHQAERFLAVEQARGKAPGTFGDLAYYVRKLQKDCRHLPGNLDVSTISEATVTDFYSWLRNESGQAPIVQKKLWGYLRRLVRFMAGQRFCPIPINLDDKIFSFDVTAQKVRTYPIAEVRAMLVKLPPRLKLYALLALNCGMLGVDMATLRHGELKDGRITRKRTKTRRGENVPTVEYVLWPETVELLRQYPPSHPEFVLTSLTGTPLWTAVVKDGRKKKKDLVSLQWRRGRGEGRAHKPPIPLKALRSVAANVLEGHKDHGRFTPLFLGHSPTSIKDKHYAAPPQPLFDEAVLWLRGEVLGN